MIIISIVAAFFNGTLEGTVAAGLSAAQSSVTTVISFAGMMCFWTGLLKISENSGISRRLGKFMLPITGLLFPKLEKDSKALQKITENMTANFLGMGNAATPSGIEAMHELDKINKTSEKPSPEMCIFTVLNTCSIGLIPTTIISLRASAGSENPASVVLPIWISSLLSLLFALIAVKLLQRSRK